jgi:hypothetical protein
VLYDIVSSSSVEVLCFSRKKNESPPLNNPLTKTEIVRKKRNISDCSREKLFDQVPDDSVQPSGI